MIWSVLSGALPPGLQMNQHGVLSGTPASFGTSMFTIQVQDKTAATATKSFSLTVHDYAPAVGTDANITLESQSQAICGSTVSGADPGACAGGMTATDSTGMPGALQFSSSASSDFGALRTCQAVSVSGSANAVLPVNFSSRASFRDQITIEPGGSNTPAAMGRGRYRAWEEGQEPAEAEVELTVEGTVVAVPAIVPAGNPDPSAPSGIACLSNRPGGPGGLFGLPLSLGGGLNTIGSMFSRILTPFGLTPVYQIIIKDSSTESLAQQLQSFGQKFTIPLPAGTTSVPLNIDFNLNTILGGTGIELPDGSLKLQSDPAQMEAFQKMMDLLTRAMQARQRAEFSIVQAIGRTVKVASILIKDKKGNPVPNVRVQAASGHEYPIDARNTPPAPPVITAGGTTNGASNLAGPVAPGEIVVLYGTGMGPSALANLTFDEHGRFATQVAGTRVLFDGHPAPLIYTSATQIGAIVPYGIGSATTTMLVEYNSRQSSAVTLPVAAAAPGIFTTSQQGTGQGAILNQDYGLNGAANPAAKGSYIMIYGTGEGLTNPPGVDGQLAVVPLPAPLLPVEVEIDGVTLPSAYAGGAPGLVAGLVQVNVQIPENARAGALPIALKIGGITSQPGVTVAVR